MEYLIGTEEGTISARSIRRFAVEAKRHDRELIDSMMGVPWDQGTTIGRPKRKQEAVLPRLLQQKMKARSRARLLDWKRQKTHGSQKQLVPALRGLVR